MIESYGDRLKRLRTASGKSVVALAKEVGITKQAWYAIERGESGQFAGDNLVRAAIALGVTEQEITTGKPPKRKPTADVPGEYDAFSFVPKARVTVSAGHGTVIYDEGAQSALAFRTDYLRDQGVSGKNAVIVTVDGDSMSPTLHDGAVLLVHQNKVQKIRNGDIYAYRLGEHCYVKRLYQDADGIIARSDNQELLAGSGKRKYADVLITEKSEHFELIGRAIWMGRKL